MVSMVRPTNKYATMIMLRTAWRAMRQFKRLRPWTSLGVRVIAPDTAGNVLLVRHSYVAGWHLPGGGVGRFETIAAAARREVKEETGIDLLDPLTVLGVYAHFSEGYSDQIALVLAGGAHGSIRVDGFEILEAALYPPASLPLETTEATRRRLLEWQNKLPFQRHWSET